MVCLTDAAYVLQQYGEGKRELAIYVVRDLIFSFILHEFYGKIKINAILDM